jgi:hypothetical protein
MELNESLIKVDQTLDSTVKKIEKQAKELIQEDLYIELSKTQKRMLIIINSIRTANNSLHYL